MANNEVSQVCSLPLPPAQYVSNFSEENIKRGRAPKPPPPVQDTYSMFGNTFNADDTIIRPLESQGIKRLYPQHFDRRRELRKLNHSLLVNFLDLLDLLVKCPESPRRAEKVEDLSLLFIHIHHLLNEFRPHQARETLRVMMDVQRRQRMETTQRFQKHLDKRNKSNATHLYLKKVTKSLKGRYSCEVSADAPSFRTAFFSGDMNIVVIPTGLPEVQLVKTKYRIGETLKAECISKDSRPAANLTWGINGQQLDSENVKKFSVIRDPETDLETSISLLSIEVQRDHFSSTGRLKVRCTASISNVYWRTSERSAEEDRPKVLDAAQVRKPTELIFDTTPAPSRGSRTICRWSQQGIIEPTIIILNLLICFSSLFLV